MNIYKIIRCAIDQKCSIREIYNCINKYDYKIVVCPICNRYMLDSYTICSGCNWEYEELLDENEESSANHMSINEYRKMYKKYENK